MNRKVELYGVPKKIVSIVPSQTELLYNLGCEDAIVGQTIFCVHPKDKFKSAAKIGGTKKLKINEIRALNPDLIIGNKEENTQSEIEILEKEFPVWMSDIFNLEDSLQMILSLGKILDKEVNAELITNEIRLGFKTLPIFQNQTCLYLIWRKPWMAAGTNTFINDMLKRCNLSNVCSLESRYPELNNDKIQRLNPKVILLSSEPYPFKEKHINELQELLPQSKIVLVDGELFSWYGSRLCFAPSYFKHLMNQIQ